MSSQVYSSPIAFLPSDSQIVSVETAEEAQSLPNLEMRRAAQLAKQAHQHLSQHIIPASDLKECLLPLVQSLDQLLSALPALDFPTTPDPQALKQAAADQSPQMAQDTAFYDAYFQVIRVKQMPPSAFLHQWVMSTRRLLQDLPFCFLDLHQVEQLLQTITCALEWILHRFGRAAGESVAQQTPTAKPPNDQPLETAWAKGVSASLNEQVAFFRWRNGHHFFALAAILCRDALLTAIQAIEKGDHQGHPLTQASHFLRGTTAAMWYAGAFSSQIYAHIIRPSMVMPHSKVGFTGDQNADYNRLKITKKSLKKLLVRQFGPKLEQAPHPLKSAFRSFHETEKQDLEQHLIIAANKVGTDESLAQKVWQHELPPQIPKHTAVDILREMIERKRNEFK